MGLPRDIFWILQLSIHRAPFQILVSVCRVGCSFGPGGGVINHTSVIWCLLGV